MKPPSLISLTRLYRLLLVLYPKDHRREYGALMEQLFRDQCRDALNRSGRRGLVGLWAKVFTDLLLSASRERLNQLLLTMNKQSIDKLSLKLLTAAILLAGVASPALVQTGFARECLYLSTLALLARAVVEWHRPLEEWRRGLVWMTVLLVIYALIMPFWAKMHALHGDAYPATPVVDGGAVFLNAAIALLRPLITRFGGRAGGGLPS